MLSSGSSPAPVERPAPVIRNPIAVRRTFGALLGIALGAGGCDRPPTDSSSLPCPDETRTTASATLRSRLDDAQRTTAEDSEQMAALAAYYDSATTALSEGNLALYVTLRDGWKYSRSSGFTPLSAEVRTSLDQEYRRVSFLGLKQARKRFDKLVEDVSEAIRQAEGEADLDSFREEIDKMRVTAEPFGPQSSGIAAEYREDLEQFAEFLSDFEDYRKAVQTGKAYDIKGALISLIDSHFAAEVFTWDQLEAMKPSVDFGIAASLEPARSIEGINAMRKAFESWKASAPPAALDLAGDLDERIGQYEKVAGSIAKQDWDEALKQISSLRRQPKKELAPFFTALHEDAARQVASNRLAMITESKPAEGQDLGGFVMAEAKSEIEAGAPENAVELLRILADLPIVWREPDWFDDEYRGLRSYSYALRSLGSHDPPAALYYLRLALRDAGSNLLQKEFVSSEIETLTREHPELLEKPFVENPKSVLSEMETLRREVHDLQQQFRRIETEVRK